MPAARQSAYSSTPGGYYRRPNRKKNPVNLFKLDTYTKILPAGVAGIWLTRWAIKMAGPFEPDATGTPVPGFKHAIAVALAAQIGGPLIGNLFGGAREVDIAQIAALSWGGDMFLTKRFLKDTPWITENVYLGQYDDEYDDEYTDNELGADTFTDAAGNKYIRTASGWALADWQFGQAEAMVPEDASPGDIIQTPSGDIFEVLEGGTLRGMSHAEAGQVGTFYNGMGQPESLARRLEAPTPGLPGGAYPTDMQGFTQTSPLGGFMPSTPLGHVQASSNNSFGYA